MTNSPGDRLRFTYFGTFTPGGPPSSRWNNPNSAGFDYLSLDDWIRLAKNLEAAKFDGMFWADHIGVHDIYKGSWGPTVEQSPQFPLNDPVLLAAALTSSTSDLGFIFSGNVIQTHPYYFARQLATIDHLTKGRAGWNIVTSFQPSAWRNLGFDHIAGHDERYRRAEEYVTVLYKLLEGSWEDDAVVRDVERRIYAEADKVHEIHHEGEYYNVPGIMPTEPSVQRMPLLFQAGSSSSGRDFSARNAEAIFMSPRNPRAAESFITDMQQRLGAKGRRPTDILYFIQQAFIVGSTEEEAKRKSAELDEYFSLESILAYMSSMLDVDLSGIDLDTPIGEFETNAMQGTVKALIEAAPDKSWKFRELVMSLTDKRTVGTPEQIADALMDWKAAGVNGISVNSVGGWGDIFDFTAYVVPELQKRGLMQSEYQPGTIREKLFHGTSSESGAHLNDRHPAARYRAPRTRLPDADLRRN